MIALIIFFRYEKQYLHVKAPRKLVWKPSLGCVTLDVTFEDRAAPCVDLPWPPHAPPGQTCLRLFMAAPPRPALASPLPLPA